MTFHATVMHHAAKLRLVIVLCLVVLAICLMSGCGGGNKGSGTPSTRYILIGFRNGTPEQATLDIAQRYHIVRGISTYPGLGYTYQYTVTGDSDMNRLLEELRSEPGVQYATYSEGPGED